MSSSEEDGINKLELTQTQTRDHYKPPNGENLDLSKTNSLSLSPDVFEKLFLSPQSPVKGDARKTFGNPTPLALVGFLLSSTPLACTLLGWRGAGGSGDAETAVFIFMGGMLQIIAGVLEWIMGNTFISIVVFTYGSFWLQQGATSMPFFNAAGAYSSTPGAATPASTAAGAATPEYLASYAFFNLFLGFVGLIYMICALRVNIILVLTFLLLFTTNFTLAGAYWVLAQGKTALGEALTKTGGGLIFAFSLLIWYLLLVQMLASVDFPLVLPVGDLSGWIKPKSQREKKSQ